MAAGGATATEMTDVLINKHRVTTDYASLIQKDIKNDSVTFGPNSQYWSAVIKAFKNVGKGMVPPSDRPASTEALCNVGSASMVVDTSTVGQMHASEPRDECDHGHLSVEDEQEKAEEEALENLGGSINVDRELEQDQLEEMGIFDDDANEFDEINI
jgi:hypothetical protein